MTATSDILRPLLPALAAALLAVAPQAHGKPLMWGIEGPGVREIGFWLDDVWNFNINNYGSSSGDNMIRQTFTTLNGSRLELIGVFVNGVPTSSWTLNDTHTELEVHYGIAAGNNATYDLLFQPGCYPGRLQFSALADNGGNPLPFNDLIIGPPYAQPSLALAPHAAPGPGTNAVSLAIASDAETLLLQATASLAPTNWVTLARFAVTGAVTVVTDTNAAPARFYRAVVP